VQQGQQEYNDSLLHDAGLLQQGHEDNELQPHDESYCSNLENRKRIDIIREGAQRSGGV
jgi:hypothetical protein